jgi:hypothetical protein
MHMRSRFALAVVLGTLVVATTVSSVAGREFGTVYVDGFAYRTFGVPARIDPGSGTDPIISFTNFDQGGVAQFAPGDGSRGGRWAVTMATWNDPADARLVTDYQEILELADAGEITLERAEGADFRCPLLPPAQPVE